MDINTNIAKSLGPKESRFILALYERGRSIFNLNEAAELTGLSGKKLHQFMAPLIHKEILVRIIPGLFSIVPFELGYTKSFVGNPYVIAREIVRYKFKTNNPQYYISHACAFELLQMVTQPQLVIFVTVTQQIKQKINIMGIEFRFVTCKEKDFFGFKKFWIDKSEMVFISDLERTIIDGLKIPEYCGGITEVAKGLWIKRHEINLNKLIEYSERINMGIIYKRLGFLLETYEIGSLNVIKKLQDELTTGYQLLDPSALNEGKYNARWLLRLNVSKEELLSVTRT